MQLATHINSACGLVRRADGLILLIKNPRRGWEFPGGIIEQGESPIEALKREIFEESGIVATPVAFVGAYANLTMKEGYGPLQDTVLPPRLILSFICEYVSGEPTPSNESPEIEWVIPPVAQRRVVHPSVAMRLRDMLNYDGIPVFRSFKTEDDGTVMWIEQTYLEAKP